MAVIRALGERTRLRIVRLVLRRRRGVNDLAARLGVPQYTVSKHLRILRKAGLLDVEKAGQVRRYGLAAALRPHVSRRGPALRLECCTFRFDKIAG
jgi:DNA-binding transcriptional ArsR family regulator